MKGLSVRVLIGILFSVIGTVSLFVSQQALTGAIWLSFGNGLILSDLRFTKKDEQGNLITPPVPKARMYAAIFLIVLAIGLLILQVIMDFNRTGK
jgi:hypothetical protein